jgi:hypothetical protein
VFWYAISGKADVIENVKKRGLLVYWVPTQRVKSRFSGGKLSLTHQLLGSG